MSDAQPRSPVATQPRSPAAPQPHSPAAPLPRCPAASLPRCPAAPLPRCPLPHHLTEPAMLLSPPGPAPATLRPPPSAFPPKARPCPLHPLKTYTPLPPLRLDPPLGAATVRARFRLGLHLCASGHRVARRLRHHRGGRLPGSLGDGVIAVVFSCFNRGAVPWLFPSDA